MSNADDFLRQNPNIKFGEEVTEQVPVKKVQYNPETKKVTSITELENIKTTYMNIPFEKYRCQDGTHVFEPTYPLTKYVFKCKNCRFSRKVYPVKYKFDEKTGALLNRFTNKRI